MAAKPKAAAAAAANDDPKPAADKSETVHEFVLYRREGEGRAPLMSDHDLDVVQAAKIDAIREASKTGRPRPELFITDRKCTYPLANGKRQGEGSTCDETEV